MVKEKINFQETDQEDHDARMQALQYLEINPLQISFAEFMEVVANAENISERKKFLMIYYLGFYRVKLDR